MPRNILNCLNLVVGVELLTRFCFTSPGGFVVSLFRVDSMFKTRVVAISSVFGSRNGESKLFSFVLGAACLRL